MSVTRFSAGNFQASLQQAIAELNANDAGKDVTWYLPKGRFELPLGMTLGHHNVSLNIVGNDTRLVFKNNLLGATDVSDEQTNALELLGDGVILQNIKFQGEGTSAISNLIGLSINAKKSVHIQQVEFTQLHAQTLTVLDFESPEVNLDKLVLAGMSANTTATALHLGSAKLAQLKEIQIDAIRGKSVRLVSGNIIDCRVDDFRQRRIFSSDDDLLSFDLDSDSHLSVNGYEVQRELQGPNLQAALQAAQEQLINTPDGGVEIWHLPSGRFNVSEPLQLGAEQISLQLLGSKGICEMRFGTASDDIVALSLSGYNITLDGLLLTAKSDKALTAIKVEAGASVRIDDVSLRNLQSGTVLVGLDVNGQAIELSDVDIYNLGSSDKLAAIRVDAVTQLSLQRLRVNRLQCTGASIGIDAKAQDTIHAYAISTNNINGTQASGAKIVCTDNKGEVQLLDVSADRISATEQEAIGLMIGGYGDVEMRSMSARRVTGARSLGVLAAAGAELNWRGGVVERIQGSDGGAAGVRLLAMESEKNIEFSDVTIDAVFAPETNTPAMPGDSWLNWWQQEFADSEFEQPWPSGESHIEDVVGLYVGAYVAESRSWLSKDPGAVNIHDSVIRRVTGTALQVDAGLRDVQLNRCEAWTSLRGAWIEGERIRLLQLTWHRHFNGFMLGICQVTFINSLITAINEGASVIFNSETEFDEIASVYVEGASELFTAIEGSLPYVRPGPLSIPASMQDGQLPGNSAVNLQLSEDHGLSAHYIPGDTKEVSPFVGAHEADDPARCHLRDPLELVRAEANAVVEDNPVIDYRNRDARSFLALMKDRAGVVMPEWKEQNAADQTSMWFELLAFELDKLSYSQEVAVSEGYISTALTRRSVEDHARLVDYSADPGLSATTMVQFTIDDEGLTKLHLPAESSLTIPAGTLLVNPDAQDDLSLIFSTETDLEYDPQLRDLTLAQAIAKGAISAVINGDLVERGFGISRDRLRIDKDRWLVFKSKDPQQPSLVVKVVKVELGVDSTRIYWDPRRPAIIEYGAADQTIIYANVVPAHHGVPLSPLSSQLTPGALTELVELLQPWREQMSLEIDNRDGKIREVELPVFPISVQAGGWPIPNSNPRRGITRIEVWVDGEQWDLVDDLSNVGSREECFVLRAGRTSGATLRFGDGVNGASLPRHNKVSIELSLRVGLGRAGNVGQNALTRILGFGNGGDIGDVLPTQSDRDELIAQYIKASNVVSAIGGRDPEALEHIRYWAPRNVRDNRAAVALSDYESLLEELPEVAATHAVMLDVGIRRVIRITTLLKNEDTLVRNELGELSEAERLRRWALVRKRLASIRLMGFDAELLPPRFVPLDLDVIVDAEPWANAEQLRHQVIAALSDNGGLFDPDVSGLGGDVYVDRLHQAVLAVTGVAAVRIKHLRRLQRNAIDYVSLGRLPIGADEVAVLRHPYQSGVDGLLTVEVCGGVT